MKCIYKKERKDLSPGEMKHQSAEKANVRELWFQDNSVFRGRHTSSYGSLLRTAETPSLDIILTVNRNLGNEKRKGQPPRGLRIVYVTIAEILCFSSCLTGLIHPGLDSGGGFRNLDMGQRACIIRAPREARSLESKGQERLSQAGPRRLDKTSAKPTLHWASFLVGSLTPSLAQQ